MINKFAVIGMGRFGHTVAIALAKKGAEVLAIDADVSKVEDMRDEVAYAVSLDATDVKALRSQNVQDMDAVIVAIGEDFESMLLCTVNLLDLGVNRIIARAMNKTQRLILEKMGLKEIISPEDEVGISLAERLLTPGILSVLPMPDDYEFVEISTPKNIINRTIEEVEFRKKYDLNLITIKRASKERINGKEQMEQHILGVPKPDMLITDSDTLILMGKALDIKRFIEINQ